MWLSWVEVVQDAQLIVTPQLSSAKPYKQAQNHSYFFVVLISKISTTEISRVQQNLDIRCPFLLDFAILHCPLPFFFRCCLSFFPAGHHSRDILPPLDSLLLGIVSYKIRLRSIDAVDGYNSCMRCGGYRFSRECQCT